MAGGEKMYLSIGVRYEEVVFSRMEANASSQMFVSRKSTELSLRFERPDDQVHVGVDRCGVVVFESEQIDSIIGEQQLLRNTLNGRFEHKSALKIDQL